MPTYLQKLNKMSAPVIRMDSITLGPIERMQRHFVNRHAPYNSCICFPKHAGNMCLRSGCGRKLTYISICISLFKHRYRLKTEPEVPCIGTHLTDCSPHLKTGSKLLSLPHTIRTYKLSSTCPGQKDKNSIQTKPCCCTPKHPKAHPMK